MSDSPLPPLPLPGLLSTGTGPGTTPAPPASALLLAEPLPAADGAGLVRFANLLARGLQSTTAPAAPGATAHVPPARVVSPASPGMADLADPRPDRPAAVPEDGAAEEAALAMAALAGGLAPLPALPPGPLPEPPLPEPPSPANLPAQADGPAAATLASTSTGSGASAGAASPPQPAMPDGAELAPPMASAEAGPAGRAGSNRPPASEAAAAVSGELVLGAERLAVASSGGGITELAAGAVPSAGQSAAPAPAAERAAPPLPNMAERAAWGEALGERLTWLVRGELEQAQLELNPPELGRLDVRLRLQGDQASVSFASGAAEVREALEQALPRLRDMLAETGIELTDAQVGAHPRDREPTPERTPGSDAADELESAMPAPAEPTDLAPAVHGTRLIDRFV